VLAIGLCALVAAGCATRSRRSAGPDEQPFDRVYAASFDSAATRVVRSRALPSRAFRRARQYVVMKKAAALPRVGADSAHYHPLVRRWLDDSTHAPPRAELILMFRSPVDPPRFPAPLADSLVGSPEWVLQRQYADSIVAWVRGQRADEYAADSVALLSRGVITLDRAWLVHSMLVDAPVRRPVLRAIVDTLGAVYVQPRYARERPPRGNGYDGDDPIVAREQIDSDPYVPFAPQYGRVALLDAGVNGAHELLAGKVATTYDCVTADCAEAEVADPCGGHGTAASALLSGDVGDERFAGVTDASLDVYAVYKFDGDCSVGPLLDTWAAGRAIAHATAQSTAIIVAEVDGVIDPSWGYDADDWNHLASAADEAVEDGALVIAAAGNQGEGHIASPAVARRVLAAGAYHVVTGNRHADEGTGPTEDGRFKPDVSGPTNTETAENDGGYETFGATSGATPYVGGGAALLRNWLVQATGGPTSNLDPGQVVAQIILSGRSPSTRASGSTSDAFDALEGAGRIELPTGGYGWFGKTSIDATGDITEIEISITADLYTRIEAALWWPETPLSAYEVPPGSDTHNDIDLQLEDPEGNVTESRVAAGVFERATAEASDGR
jgi:hypothetical protein